MSNAWSPSQIGIPLSSAGVPCGAATRKRSPPMRRSGIVTSASDNHRGGRMNNMKIVAIVLIVIGGIALAIGSFSYTKETHGAKLGPIELSVKEKETVNIPVWAGVAAIVVGGLMLLAGGRKG